jgi:tellurite methyltransferase
LPVDRFVAREGKRLRPGDRFKPIEADALYQRLAMGEPFCVLDVRTEGEYAAAHIPGSILMPLHELPSRAGEIPNGGTPIAVVAEHGQRSVSACSFLAERGYHHLFNLDGGLERWPGPLAAGLNGEHHPHQLIAPTPWLVENFHHLPKGLALDVAMGNGRNAIFLATRGFDVDGVDVDPEVVAQARQTARRFHAPIRAIIGNVEDGTYILPIESYDVIVVFNFLHRPLFRDIKDGLKPGGVVVYQTYLEDQIRFGRPTNPAHLLKRGELAEVFASFDVLRHHERVDSAVPGGPPCALAGIVARKPV